MVIELGEKLHVIYRSLYDKSNRRHFVGEVRATDRSLCRLEGWFFVYDERKTEFVRIGEKRTIIVDAASSGLVVNVIERNAVLDAVRYRYVAGSGLVATDGRSFSLNINEFGGKS